MKKDIRIAFPTFDLHELVTFHWNGKQIPTRITLRYYDIDEGRWMYGIAGREGLVNESLLEPREA
jgi:hypothetical protein